MGIVTGTMIPNEKCVGFPPTGGLCWVTFFWKVTQKK